MARAAGEASGSSAASSSGGMGRPLAKSAASSSFASGVTRDLQGGEGTTLMQATLAAARQLEQRQERREHLPRLGAGGADVHPAHVGAQREQPADRVDRAVHVERAR